MPRRPRLTRSLLLSMLLAVVPACSASAGHKWGRAPATAADGSGRVAYRPAYPLARTRALYLSGYAGATYGPGGPGGPLSPTGFVGRLRRPGHGH